MHLLSVDLEDWYTDVARVPGFTPRDAARAFTRQLAAIERILDLTDTRCTFFVLGTTAERFPDDVARLASANHEIASHGYAHVPLGALDRAGFERDLIRATDVLTQITGQRAVGYRAPYFSLPAASFSVHDVLAAHDYQYSSSTHGQAPDRGHRVAELSTSALGPLPIGGGGWWRALPSQVVTRLARHYERTARRLITYVHPHEFDPDPLEPRRGLARYAYVNTGRRGVPALLKRLLSTHRFGTYRGVLQDLL